MKSSRRYGFPPIEIPWRYVNHLQQLPWPGNVRQLVNFCEKIVILCEGEFNPKVFETLYTELFDYSLIQEDVYHQSMQSLPQILREKSRKDEIEIIRQTLGETKDRKTDAARKLGISRTTLWRRLKTMN
jgi:DNA-binding NtrC family response regulator